jgi:hypothetical protein
MVLAAAILLMEAALISRKRVTIAAALSAPIVLILSACLTPTPNSLASGFLDLFVAEAGSPIFMAVAVSAGLYGMAWIRGLKVAEAGVVVCLAALTFVPLTSLAMRDFTASRPAPLLLATGLSLISAWRLGGSWRYSLAACMATAWATVLMRGSWWTAWDGVLPIHVLFFALMVVGARTRDSFAVWVRGFVVLFGSLAPLGVVYRPEVPTATTIAYLLTMSAGLIVFGRSGGGRPYYWAGGINLGHASLWVAGAALGWLLTFPRGVLLVLSGMSSFVVAGYVSFLKAWSLRRRVEDLASPSEPRGPE